jgi:hypothetical protein
MQRHILLFLLCGGIGFAGGFYLAIAFQRQIAVLVGAAIVIAVLTWVGSGADLLGLLRDWYKDKRDEEKMPNLEFGKYFKIDEPPRSQSTHVSAWTVYYVKVINNNKKSEGLIESCAGYIRFRDGLYRTIWEDNSIRHFSFGKEASLRLFHIQDNVLKFYHVVGENMLNVTPDFPYADIQEENIIIELEAARGHCPQLHSEKIKDIMKKAKS